MPAQEKVDRDLQLSIYAMGLQKRWPHLAPENIKLSLVFLKHGEKLSTARTKPDFEKTETETLETIRDIETRVRERRDFEPLVSPLCDFCGYKPICPAWRHLYKNVKTEEVEGAKVPSLISEYFQLKEEKRRADFRLKEIATLLTRYLDSEEVERVFGAEGVIAKRKYEKYEYDFEKIRSIIEPLGRWQDIMKADEARLRAILKEIPEWAREEIKKARTLVRTSISLTATKKHVRPPDASPGGGVLEV
jgi:hypothetical protein